MHSSSVHNFRFEVTSVQMSGQQKKVNELVYFRCVGVPILCFIGTIHIMAHFASCLIGRAANVGELLEPGLV